MKSMKDRATFLKKWLKRQWLYPYHEHPQNFDNCWYRIVRPWLQQKEDQEIVLYATYVPHHRLSLANQYTIDALCQEQLQVIIIAMIDPVADIASTTQWLQQRWPDAVILLRANQGYDFAAWAHCLLIWPDILQCSRLFCMNDSILGPSCQRDLKRLLRFIRASSVDVLGLMENFVPCWHLQSYFLVFQNRALHHPALSRFWQNVGILSSKQAVIDTYETTLSAYLAISGLRVETIYHLSSSYLGHNPSIKAWREALELGCPFVKVSALPKLLLQQKQVFCIPKWQIVLKNNCFDMKAVQDHLQYRGNLPLKKRKIFYSKSNNKIPKTVMYNNL